MGHAFDLNNIIKNNRSLKKGAHIKYEKVKAAYHKINARYPDFVDRKKLSESELQQLKRKIRVELIKDDKRIIMLTITISIFILCSVLFYLGYRYQFF